MSTHNDLADRLIRRAARRAPPVLASRLEEEWLADLSSRNGTAARLRLAAGCWWATAVITREFAVPQVVASGAAGTGRTLIGTGLFDVPGLSRRTVAFLVIAGVHVLLIYVFATGFAQHVFVSPPPVTQGVVIVEARPQHMVAPVPTLTLTRPTITTPLPDPVPPIDADVPQATVAPEVSTAPTGAADRTSPPPAVHRLAGGPGKGFPNPDDFYPATSRRLSETGSTTVQVCVDTQGRLASDPVVTQSSGISRLDDGALKLARAGSGHYRPSTENGQAVSSCYPYRIRFRLDD